MKKNPVPAVLAALLTAVLLVLLVMGLPTASPGSSLLFRVGDETITPWEDEEGTLHLFLPAWADPAQVQVEITRGRFRLDGNDLADGSLLPLLWQNSSYPLSFRCLTGRADTFLQLHRASALTAIHVTTVTGSMENVHTNKNQKEKISLSIYSPDGAQLYSGKKFKDLIRGRGNSTWGYDKRPYNLYLDKSADLLGSGASRHWCLLANTIDFSDLRNRLIYRLAADTAPVWCPDTAYADLYLNGEYAGLYLLTDKVEAAPTRFVPEDGDVLFNLEANGRADPFRVDNLMYGVSAEIRWPEKADELPPDTETDLRALFSGLKEHTIPEDQLGDCFDLESWAWLYLVQEASVNYDAARYSLYFYLRQGRLYAGPIWDYDNTLGVNPAFSPRSFYARDRGYAKLWSWFWSYPAFRQQVIEQYQTRFSHRLHTLLAEDLPQEASAIQASEHMNDLRWQFYLDNEPALFHGTDATQLENFLLSRIAFLDSAWIEGREYITVTATFTDHDPIPISVEPGQPLGKALTDLDEVAGQPLNWTVKETGAPFTASTPVTEPIAIRAAVTPPEEPEAPSLSFAEKLVLYFPQLLETGILLCFGLFFLLLLLAAFLRRSRERM